MSKDTTDLVLNEDNEIIRLSDDKKIAVYRPDASGEDAIQFAHWKFKEYTDAILALIEEGPAPTAPPPAQPAPEPSAELPVDVIEKGEFKGFPVQTEAGDLTPGWPEAVLERLGREEFDRIYKRGMRLTRYNRLRVEQGLDPIT